MDIIFLTWNKGIDFNAETSFFELLRSKLLELVGQRRPGCANFRTLRSPKTAPCGDSRGAPTASSLAPALEANRRSCERQRVANMKPHIVSCQDSWLLFRETRGSSLEGVRLTQKCGREMRRSGRRCESSDKLVPLSARFRLRAKTGRVASQLR